MHAHRWLKQPRPAPRRPRLEPLEDRTVPSAGSTLATGFRPIDEVGNNLANPTLGTAGTDLIRISPVGYADGISAPSLPNDPSARTISNAVSDQTDPANPAEDLDVLNSQSLSDFVYVFGQFVDHDMDLTPDGGASFPISVAPGDPIGQQPFTRSQTDPSTGTSTANPLQQVNAVTSFLDLSQVYGSDAARADALRTHSGGQLKTSPGNMLPYDNTTYFSTPLAMANDSGAVPTSALFATGDVRGNENIELTALQTLFVRNHNRLAAQLQAAHPDWTDEQLYQEARKINIAQYQTIVYTEFLPALLGGNALPRYAGYNPNVNPGIANEFSTALFRFGHSMLDNEVDRLNNNGTDISDPAGASVDLTADFFDPNLINPNGVIDPLTGHVSTDIDPVLKGIASGVAQETDLLAVRDIRNLLFGNGASGGQDLIARDIQRGRDNGLPDYNTMRAAYGLPRVTSFAQITSNVKVQQELQQVYGSVNNIDAFVGALAEDHVPGSDVGPLLRAGLADQFRRLRDGDRFFYLNEQWTPEELKLLNQTNTMARVIEANTGVTNLQSDVFAFKASISGTVLSGQSTGGRRTPAPTGLANVTVQLKDADGDVVATTTTDARGRYSFNQLTGLGGTGDYTVSVVAPSGFTQTSANPATIHVSRGDVNVSGVNFTLSPSRQGTPPPTRHATTGGASSTGQTADPTVVDALFAAMGHRSR
jgi:peroxidase